jgi:ABC-type antimicrobial peptide transport system permease subunit
MDRLSLYLTLATGPVTTGVLVIAAMSMGYYGWPVIGTAAAIGFLLAWPAAYLVSRRIKRKDPDFDHTREARSGMVPDPRKPEL